MEYISYLPKNLEVIVVEHINYEGHVVKDNIHFSFFKSRNKFFHIPFKTLRYIRNQEPDVVIVQGCIFPFKLLVLKLLLQRDCAVIVQHHGERPFNGLKRVFQQVADLFVDAYMFTTLGNSNAWIDKKVIKNKDKIFEVLEGSSYFKKQDKQASRAKLEIEGKDVFLWVGRLAVEKDPLTVLGGFEKYLHYNPEAKLYMIYQAETLLPEVQAKINNSSFLQKGVHLVGKIPHPQLESWYSAADFFILGSHREGSGFALIESMACGCIPVVTAIPSFKTITVDGDFGFLYKVENEDSLLMALIKAGETDKDLMSGKVLEHFHKNMSFSTIANKIFDVITLLKNKKS